MCGIFGWLSWGAPVPLAACERGLAELATRGPNGSGLWQSDDGRLVLGHRRLATQDLQGGTQPLHAPEYGLSAVVNGELYHSATQRAELARWGYRFRTHSDSELVLALYARHGRDFVHHLQGEFALLLWNGEQLLAVRDRFGIKPLCYHLGSEGLQVASKGRALLALELPDLSAEWDLTAWQQALGLQYLLPSDHLLKGIQTLPPGHLLEVSRDGRCRVERWWELDYPPQNTPMPALAVAEATQRLKAGLHSAVAQRRQAEVPVCAHLSGGIDSSAVLAELCSQSAGAEVTAFHVRFAGRPDYDEAAQAAATARFCGARLEILTVTTEDLIAALPDSVARGEGLVINGHVAAKYLLNQAISAQGFRVVLTGEGADELLLGYSHLLQDLGQPQVQPLLQGMHLASGAQLDLRAVEQGLGGHLPGFLQAKASLGARLHSLLDGVSSTLAASRLADWLPLDALAGRQPVHQSAWLWNRLALSGYILHTVGDGTEMAHGVEGRLPFLDHQLFAALQPLQPLAHLEQGKEKALLRRAFAGRLPEAVLQGGKRPFLSPPLLAHPGWQNWLRERLLDGPALPLVKRSALETLLQRLPQLSAAEQLLWDPPLHLLLSGSLLQSSWQSLARNRAHPSSQESFRCD
ncbi:MAG: asparagine synthase (glutamine-hydrolyzing) [Candidatus Sericytochromatia bacterium]